MGEKRENAIEEIFKVIIAENFPKLMTNTKQQIQKAQRTPSKIYILKRKKKTPRHIYLN